MADTAGWDVKASVASNPLLIRRSLSTVDAPWLQATIQPYHCIAKVFLRMRLPLDISCRSCGLSEGRQVLQD
ncbi:hypothetical protein N7457_006401 [Penicillium paradoxum]|uniref:uncharacterized protein n=1 Tax=Penicillium paradoxum TaxID=176176 RepID=UPI002546E6A7|nr:uncharacterized protein N7457_006401 [Penicillium paradoxum]KAJ5781241.1 hypothetical protein N7457_006401 [Penicillium paradoxum]